MPAGISYAAGVFHARSAFHKSTKWIYFIEKSTLSRASACLKSPKFGMDLGLIF